MACLTRRTLTILLVAGLCFPCAWSVPTETLMLKMSDGTELATDYYLPEEGGPAWPTIVVRSAYPRQWGERSTGRFLRDGYACVVQDIRGMGGSKGEKNAFYADGWRPGIQDGRDTIEWVKEQPWCNGKIATYGESALGITQVLMAPTTGLIACQSIEVAPSDFYHNLAYHGGVWRKNLCEIWLSAVGLGGTAHIYKGHPRYDDFWPYYNADVKAPEITAPAMHVGGWHDIFQQGTINNFVTRQNHGGPGAKGNQKLIMKWSTHGGDDCPNFKYPKNRHDLNIGAKRRAFFAYWLKGEQNGIMDEPAVHYYVMGDDSDPDAPGMEWRSADTWPPFPNEETPYCLRSGGALSTDPATDPGSVSFAFDPANPVPTCGGANLFMVSGPYDQRFVSRGRKDVLKFASAPLEAPLEATGAIKVRLYISTDAPDTDFTAKLVDIYPPGDDRELLVLDGIQRVKFRNGFEKPAPLLASADEIVEITIDLWSISWVFNTNHRIGLHISSSNYRRFDKNPNTGDDFPDENNLRVAYNTVHMDKAHPSALLLPVRPGTVE